MRWLHACFGSSDAPASSLFNGKEKCSIVYKTQNDVPDIIHTIILMKLQHTFTPNMQISALILLRKKLKKENSSESNLEEISSRI
jgi:hypothetical protein